MLLVVLFKHIMPNICLAEKTAGLVLVTPTLLQCENATCLSEPLTVYTTLLVALEV